MDLGGLSVGSHTRLSGAHSTSVSRLAQLHQSSSLSGAATHHPNHSVSTLVGHSHVRQVRSIAVNAEGTHAALAGSEGLTIARLTAPKTLHQSDTDSGSIDFMEEFNDDAAAAGKRTIHSAVDAPSPALVDTSCQMIKLPVSDVSLVAWNGQLKNAAANPNRNLVACVNDNKVMVVDINAEVPVIYTRQHKQYITGVQWSPSEPNWLLTCGADSYFNVWDIRVAKETPFADRYAFGSAKPHIAWNHHNHYEFASAQGQAFRVWDVRKTMHACVNSSAHEFDINSIDWSGQSANELATCSADKTVKVWSSDKKFCSVALQLGEAGNQALFTPFGRGLVTVSNRMPQHRRMLLWSLDNPEEPALTFPAGNDEIADMTWRTGDDLQLVTLSKTGNIALWEIPEDARHACEKPEERDKERPSSIHAGTPGAMGSSMGRSAGAGGILPHNDSSTMHTLKQEYGLLSLHKLRVIVENLDLDNQLCIVTARSGAHTIRMKIMFPDHYPHLAAPTFEFLPESTVSKDLKEKMLLVMQETAMASVSVGRTCLEACLRKLDSQLDALVQREETTMPRNDSMIPFPRTCTVCFGGNGSLVFFRAKETLTTEYKTTPKTFDEWKAYSASLTLVKSLSQSARTEDTLSGLDFFGGQKRTNRPRKKEDNPKRIRSSTSTSSLAVAPVHIVDISNHMTFKYDLAQRYKVQGISAVSMCNHSARAAAECNRFDLVKTWKMLALALDEKVLNSPLWPKHPFGGPLLVSLLKTYEKQNDVQTVAMIFAIIELAEEQFKVIRAQQATPQYHNRTRGASMLDQSIPPTATPSKSTKKDLFHIFTRSTAAGPTLSSAVATASVPPTPLKLGNTPMPIVSMPNSPSAGAKLNIDSLFATSNANHRGDLPPLMMPKYQSDPSLQNSPFNHAGMLVNADLPVFTFLTPEQRAHFARYAAVYATILERWNLHVKRAEMARFGAAWMGDFAKLSLHLVCETCNQELPSHKTNCSNCNNLWHCAVCSVPVRGLCIYCMQCKHGGHLQHVQAWFSENRTCAKACGCNCAQFASV